ncbi:MULTISPECIES: triose-phosphate isomerase [unclassified Tessaracoccus]|uniref:triose-phosphate isomerase n=1 Tax=unclassified Tessaracoccus TaxID=2635419 RepID=UPI00096ECB35|nr:MULTISPECIES: triose-phosphate isomerase [unclassified Tessaracoccus]MBB1508943.1 triose-phosphate isomerase [Tessaracoccus sp. MC1756]MCG6566214.1 triose-phosphate isomerase [Tessaracoccus sp. ZS01]OMG58698.1 triose-phosphate isomerase [Tessaracoccus sp. ZS01]
MTRKPIMAGNWKMNVDHIEATGLVEKLHYTLVDKEWDPEKSDAVLCVPFTDLRTVRTLIDGDRLKFGLGAQNVSQHDNGAYTGEISTAMLSKLGVQYVIVGHSERREYYGEDDALINAKAAKVLAAGMTPIVCVGEGLDIRKAGEHVEYTLNQVRGTLAGLTAEQVAGLVIAYEPVWAIGTGEVATPENAQEVCGAIRKEVAELYDGPTAESVRIQYGGSVKSGNVAQIMSQPDIDGALVGGASLQPEEFAAIVRFYQF